jgi:hypothetical protein
MNCVSLSKWYSTSAITVYKGDGGERERERERERDTLAGDGRRESSPCLLVKSATSERSECHRGCAVLIKVTHRIGQHVGDLREGTKVGDSEYEK